MAAREPGVESVFVANVFDAGFFDGLEISAAVKNPVRLVGRLESDFSEHWNGDTPRDLAGNVPVFQVFEIVNQNFLLVFGVKFDFVVFEMLDCDFGEFFDIDKPLFFEHWFDGGATFVTMCDGMFDFFLAS